MPRILRSRESQADYNEIWDYIAQRDITSADRLVDSFDVALATLATAPKVGRTVEFLGKDLRSFPIGNYLLFYRALPDGIELIRVLHGARDITTEFFS